MISQAMIFSAGLGKRMFPLTKNTPQQLIEITNKNIKTDLWCYNSKDTLMDKEEAYKFLKDSGVM